jgi:hypothetical protein
MCCNKIKIKLFGIIFGCESVLATCRACLVIRSRLAFKCGGRKGNLPHCDSELNPVELTWNVLQQETTADIFACHCKEITRVVLRMITQETRLEQNEWLLEVSYKGTQLSIGSQSFFQEIVVTEVVRKLPCMEPKVSLPC